MKSVTIQIVVHNGQKYIRSCLDAVRKQDYDSFSCVVLDNASEDNTREIIKNEYPEMALIESQKNLGMWPGQEFLLQHTDAPFILSLCVDVVIAPNFISVMMPVFEDESVGALQSKMYQQGAKDQIDSCGFSITRGRRVINIGHGEKDGASFSVQKEIFGVEGAAPFFRRSALNACRIDEAIWDPKFFWYGDDLDLAWRMNLFGFRQVFVPSAIAWHDRSTTKGIASGILDAIRRIKIRREIPLKKRQLDMANTRWTIIKNDSIINVLRDALYILIREIKTLGYMTLFEPKVLAGWVRFFKGLPYMIRQRKLIKKHIRRTPNEMHKWFS